VRILTVNAGSTSWKIAEVDGATVTELASLDDAFSRAAPDCVAHRVVHGGPRTAAVTVDDAVVRELEHLVELAPLHQPPALDGMRACRAQWPSVPNVACFDTAFHATIPAAARAYALPPEYRDRVRVYGFHGLSHAWAAGAVASLAPEARRVVVAHLGGGQSLCAVLDGQSVHTTMGFTPLDGLVMATRCGHIDPGAVLWLVANATEDVGDLLDRRSGLLGLAGTADLRELHARSGRGDQDARFAFSVWSHAIVTQLGGCVAALGGLDALVFTGGIGEHDAIVHHEVARAFAWLGVAVSTDLPNGEAVELTAAGASVRTFVVRAREELQLAREAAGLLAV
jgi:acetate kinase